MNQTDLPQITISVDMPVRGGLPGAIVRIPLFTVPDEEGAPYFPFEVEGTGSSEQNQDLIKLAVDFLVMNHKCTQGLLKVVKDCIK